MIFYQPRFFLLPLLTCIFLLCQSFVEGNPVVNGSRIPNTANATPNSIAMTDSLPGSCPKNEEIEKIIGDAIALGAPIYNEGLHIACYRIYEWAAYKILYEYGKSCKDVEKILKTAIEKSHGDFSDTEKAWLMRAAFDKILGVPTRTGDTEKGSVPRNG